MLEPISAQYRFNDTREIARIASVLREDPAHTAHSGAGGRGPRCGQNRGWPCALQWSN